MHKVSESRLLKIIVTTTVLCSASTVMAIEL